MERPAGKQPDPEPEPHPEHLHVEEIVLEEQPPPLHPQEAAEQQEVRFASILLCNFVLYNHICLNYIYNSTNIMKLY